MHTGTTTIISGTQAQVMKHADASLVLEDADAWIHGVPAEVPRYCRGNYEYQKFMRPTSAVGSENREIL